MHSQDLHENFKNVVFVSDQSKFNLSIYFVSFRTDYDLTHTVYTYMYGQKAVLCAAENALLFAVALLKMYFKVQPNCPSNT